MVASPSTYILHISPTLNPAPRQCCIATQVLNLTPSLTLSVRVLYLSLSQCNCLCETLSEKLFKLVVHALFILKTPAICRLPRKPVHPKSYPITRGPTFDYVQGPIHLFGLTVSIRFPLPVHSPSQSYFGAASDLL